MTYLYKRKMPRETHRVEDKQMWEFIFSSQGLMAYPRIEHKARRVCPRRMWSRWQCFQTSNLQNCDGITLLLEATQARELRHSKSRKLIFLLYSSLCPGGYVLLLVFVLPWNERIICFWYTTHGSGHRKRWLFNNCWVNHKISLYKNEFERYLVIASCLPFYYPNRFKSPQGQELLSIFVSFLNARQCLEMAMDLQSHLPASQTFRH